MTPTSKNRGGMPKTSPPWTRHTGSKDWKMMDGEEEEVRKETASPSRNTRKIPNTRPLPNKTITSKLKTERIEADIGKQRRKKKATDDEEAPTRKHKTKTKKQKPRKWKTEQPTRRRSDEGTSAQETAKKKKTAGKRKRQSQAKKRDNHMPNMNQTHWEKQ